MKKAEWMSRRLTWRGRRLPEIIIVGAQKAGTSSLFYYMQQHPQLLPSVVKEVHYFDGGLDPAVDTFKQGESWYRSHFPLKSGASVGSKVFEASPLYLFHPLVPQRMAALVPRAKVIVLLRNPRERAVSHYFHTVRKGCEDLPIEQALRSEEDRLREILRREDYKNNQFRYHSYKARGLYLEQLRRFTSCFPREQLLILNAEGLVRKPHETLRQVFEFAGVDPSVRVPNLEAKNVGHGKAAVSEEVTDYLDAFFEPHNARLFEFLGEDYGWNAATQRRIVTGQVAGTDLDGERSTLGR